MNKIFKVIWSKARSAWVVVSEIAKNHGSKDGGVHDRRSHYVWLTRAIILALVLGSTAEMPAYAAAGERVQYGSVTIGDYPNTEGDLFVYGTSKFYGTNKFYGTILFNDGEFAYDSQKHGFSFGKAQWNSKLYNYSIAIGDTGEGSDYSIVLGHNASGKGTYDVAIGDTASAEKANAVAIGKSASAQGASSIALGDSAHATETDGLSIGHSSESTMAGALAFGKEAKAHGADAVAIGTGAQANNNPYGIAIGKNAIVNNQGSIAIGQDSSSDHPYGIAIGGNNVGEKGANANGTYSIALGADSLVNGAEGGAAIGYGAKVDGSDAKDGVALGAYSVSNWATKAGVQGYLPWEGSNTGNIQNNAFQSAIASPAWQSTTAGVSIGDTSNGDKTKWITRQLTGLAAGTNDYDAVNVAQLKASMTTLSSTDGSVKITPIYNKDGSRTFDLSASGGSSSGSGPHFVSVTKNNAGDSDDSLKTAGNYNNDGATGTQSTAVGVNAQAQTQGTALGNGANASNTGATAIGTGSVANGTSSVALGQNASAQNDNAVAIGHGAGAYANSVSIGGNAMSTAERSVHIGAMTDSNTTTGSASVSIGADAKATASGAASLGTGAVASGTDALALGQNSSSAGSGSVAIGYQTQVSKDHATAVGTSAEANAIEGTVLGYNAKVNGDKGVALGSGAFVSAENGSKTSVALGAGSQVNDGDTVGTASMAIKDTYGETSDSTTYNFAGTNPSGTISVGSGSGSSEQTRTITHVAAGRVSSTSTDAINGSQLYGVTQSIEKVEQNVARTATRYYSVNATDTGTGSNYLNDGAHGINSLAAGNKAQAYGSGSVAIGLSSLAGNAQDAKQSGATAIGMKAQALGTGAIALGNGSSSSGYSMALGNAASASSYGTVALGGTAKATAMGSVALGTGSQATTNAGQIGYLSGSKKAGQADYVWKSTTGAVSLGGDFGKIFYTRQITNLAAGTQDMDAVNVAQLKAVEEEGISLTGNDNQKITQPLGGNFNLTGGLTGDALKDGAASTANLGVRKNAAGDGLEVVMTTTPSFDTVTANTNISVKNSSMEAGTSDISISGTGLSMGSKKITNLKAGSDTTDAVNYGQLKTVSDSLTDLSGKTIKLAGNDGGSISRKLGDDAFLIKGAGTGDVSGYSGKNLLTSVDSNGVLQLLLAKELKEDKLDVGTALTSPKDSNVAYPVTIGTLSTDSTIGYIGLNGADSTSAVITAYDASGTTRLDYLDGSRNAHLVALTSDGYTFAGDTGTANTLALNKTLNITGGITDTEKLTTNNIGVVSSGNGGLTVELAKELTSLTSASFGSGDATTTIRGSGVTAPAYKVGTKTYIDGSGLNANDQKVAHVQAGALSTDSTDAVNGSQLFVTNQKVSTNTTNISGLTTRLDGASMTFAGDSGTPVTKKLNETLTLTGGETSVDNLTQLSDKNIGLVADSNGKLEVRLAKNLTGLTGASFSNGNFTTQLTGNGLTITPTTGGNAVTLTAQNLDLGNRQLHGVQAGEVSATSTDAVNGSQLNTVKETAENAQTEAKKHSTVSGSGNVDVSPSDNTDGSKNYTVSLKDTVTLGSNGTAITLDGTKGTASFGSGTNAVTMDGTSGAIAGSSLRISGNVQAGSVAVGAIRLNSTADASRNIAANTITGLSNTSYTSTSQLMDDRAATEGELSDVIGSIQNGTIVKGLLTTVKEGSNISVVADDKTDSSKTQYTIGLSPVLTGLTSAQFTNGKTGTEAQTAVVTSDGISLGSEDTSAQFTRTKVSAGNQQIQHVASGLTGTTYTDAADNNAATVGDLKAQSKSLTDTGIVFAGNTGKGTLALGNTAKIQGADLADGTTLTEDYTTANLTTATEKAADGTVTTTIYGKKDMAGRSLSLGTQDAAGAIANPAAVLKAQTASSTDSTQTGHLVLKGTRPADTVTAAAQTSADIYVQDGSDELKPADSKKMTRVTYTDESTGIHELATMEDGLKFQGDKGNTSAVLLNNTLTVTGGADTAKLTTGNIGVTSDGDQGLTIALAKELKDLTSVAVTGEKFATTLTGDGMTIAPVGSGAAASSLVINASTGINLGNRKVTGLTAGTIGAGSTDAVNGSQLHTVQEAASQAQAEARKHSTVSVVDNNLVLTPTAESETKGADYALKLNNTVTLGTGDNQVVLDGSDTGISSFGKQITLNGATGAVGVTSLTASGAVSASSVTVGDIILHSVADSTVNPNVMKDTITGLGNTTYDDKNIVSNRAATEGQLQSLVSQINAGQISAGSTVVAGSSNISISSSKDDTGKITTYTASLTPELTGLTRAVFTNGKTGKEEETNTLTANGLTLGTDDGAARFTRSGISAGSQQIKNLGSGITGTDGTVSIYDTTVTGQADYNNAASIGDVQKLVQEKAAVGTNVAGNNSTQAKLALGGTISVKGSDVALSSTETLTDKLANDYSSANVTTQVTGSDGNVTTTVYLKKDLVGRSLTLGTIGSDGNVAESDRTASLYQAQSQAKDDTALTGHLFLAGEKRTGAAENPTVTHTSADLFVKDGAEGDNAKGDLLNPDTPVTRIYYKDEGNYTYALATMDDGFYAAGDSGKADILLNKTLNLKGGLTIGNGQTADALLTSGNIGVVADSGTDTLNLRLAKKLKDLTSATFIGDTTSLTVDGTGLKLTPNAGSSAKALTLTSDQIDLGGRKLQNVGSGSVAEGSTDGVNGDDVYKVQQKAEAAQTEAAKHTTVSVSGDNLALQTTSNVNGSTNYEVKLNDKVTLGTGAAKQITLDGVNGNASIGQQITLEGETGKVTASSFSTTGNVEAGSVSVGGMTLNSAESHPADKDKTQWVDKDTLTGLSNVTYKANEIHESRAATEGQLQDVVSKIKSGDISGGALTSVSQGSNITVSSTPSADGKKTDYQVSLAKDLSDLSSASFTNGKTGSDAQAAVVDATGLSLGQGEEAARFTRSGISAGGQQVTKVGSGLKKVSDTSYLYDDTVAGQENYNHAANIGDVRTLLSDARDVFAGNNRTTATLTLGKTAAFQGADVALTGSQTLEEALAADYSKANLTARTVGNSDGSVTTSLYMKQDMVGRSLSLGNIGTDGTVADPAARLYTQPVSDTDSTLTGHLKLTGTKEAKDGQTSSTSADIYVKDVLGSDLTNKERAVTRLMYQDGVDQRNHTVATLDDGFYVQGDANQGNTLHLPLTSTLKIQGNTTAGSSLTAGNIGVVSDGKDTLKVQLADTLTGLKQISFAGSNVSIGQEGINAGDLKITNVQAGTEKNDAVNVQQLDEAKAAASAEVKAGKNVTVSKDTTSAQDGHAIYTVAADFQGADVSGSNAVVYDNGSKNQVTLGGSSSTTPVKLTNLADGDISSTSTDAVTGKQLNDVITYRDQTINVAGDSGSAVKLNHGNTLKIAGDPNISTSSSGSDTAKDGTLQVSLADNVYLQGLHIGSTYPAHSDASVDSVALTADADNQTGILTLRGDATHVSDAYPRAQADISVLSAAPGQTYMAAPFLQEVYQTSSSGTTTKNQPVRLAYRDNYNTAHQIATLDDGYVFSGDNGDKNLTEKLNGTVALRGMDNEHAARVTSENADTYLTKNNIGVVTKSKVLNEDGSTQDGQVQIRLAKDLTGLTSATFTNDNGDTAVIDAKNLKLTLNAQAEGKSPVSLTSSGLDNGKNKITNVAAGTSDLDAVNYGQIKSIIGTDNNVKGLIFTGDTGSVTKHLGDTLQIFGGTDTDSSRNITTSVGNDGILYVDLNRQLQLDGLHIGQKDSSVASLTTETAVQKDGTTSTYGMLSLKGRDQAQANITPTMGTTSLASSNPITTRLTYSNDNVGNAHEIATLEDGLRFTGDNYVAAGADTPEQNVVKTRLDQTLSITGGQTDMNALTALTDKNIGVVGDATTGTLNVQLSKSLHGLTDIYMGDTAAEASHLDKTGLYLSPTSSKDYKAKFTADNGISAGGQRIQNVADGTDTSDAATVGQLQAVESKANNATTLTVNHGNASGSLTLTDNLDDDNIHHNYDIALSNTVTVGSGDTGNSITLDGTANTINGGSYVKFGGQTSSTSGIGTSPLAIGWQSASLQDVITEEAKGSKTGNYLTGLSNTSWDPVNVGYSPNRAATEGQLRDVEKQVWENPITFLGNHDADKTAEESQGIKATLGSQIRIIGTGTGEAGDFDASNLSVIAGKTTDGKSDALIIQMKKAPSFTTVNAGTPDAQGVHPVSVGQVTVTRDGKTETVDGVVITDGPMITKDGINNYGKQITHLKSGGIYNEEDKKYHYESDEVGTNAATIQDVKNIASAAAQSEVEAKRVTVSGVNDNITVAPAADNPNHYQVQLSNTLKLGQDAKSNPNILIDGQNGKVTVGSGSTGNNSVVIDGNGGTVTIGNGTSGHKKVTLNGNDGTISGLTNTSITASDFATQGRAATEEQLKQVADNVSEIKKNNSDYQLVGEKDKEGNYTGDYKVSDGNQVKLHVQDSMHPDQVKDITIDNVAKASDLGDVSQISDDIQNKENNNVVGALNNLNQKVKEAANGSWESQINGETVKKVKAGDVQNFTSGDNIQLSNDNGAIKIATKKDVSFDKVTIGSGDSKMTLDKDGLQAGKVKVSSEGINAGGNRIQGVADGKEKDDAATVGQLAQVADAAGEAINSLGNHLSRLDTRINRVGAGAAALAALHPDPNGDDAWSISAGIGNYRNSTAAAIGAFYRPNDNMIVSMGATVGNGENMINAGVTVGIGSGVSRGPVSKAALVREISALKEENQAKDAEVKNLKNQVQELQKQNQDTQEKLDRIMEKLGLK